MNWLCVNIVFFMHPIFNSSNSMQSHYSTLCLTPSSKIWIKQLLPFSCKTFSHCDHKTRFDLKLRIRTKRLKAFYSSERCDFTCVTWDAAHLHRNEYVPAGLNPQGGDALTTTTGLGWLPKLVPPGRTTHCCWQGSCTCLLIVKMALTVDWLVIL